MGRGAEQYWHCSPDARRAGERDGAAEGGGRRRSRGAGGAHTRAGSALQWARTEIDLGASLEALGERQKDAKLIEEAVKSMRGAVEAYQQAGEGYWLPIAQ